jgi:hypothetical protein
VRAWRVGIGLVLTAVVVGLGTLVSVNSMARQTVQEEHTYAFAGSALSIDVAIGEVQIVPSSKDGEIKVRRRMTYGLRRPFVEERIDHETFRLSDKSCAAPMASPCHVRWLLQVPRDVFVEVRTQTGSITVSGMRGTVKLQSESGAVKAISPSGPLVTLRSTAGTVTAQNVSSDQVVATSTTGSVSLTFRAPPSLVVGRSETGQVEVVLPDGDESYRINAKSQDGITNVTANDDPEARRRIDVRSTKGDIRVEPGSLRGS